MASQSRYHTSIATPSDRDWIFELADRVQTALTASGSLQELSILSETTSDKDSLSDNYIFILYESSNKHKLGAVFISAFNPEAVRGSWDWGVKGVGKKWYLHSLMLEPSQQGKGLGVTFLEQALRLLVEEERGGVVVLDCWAGNKKLRGFYERAGFRLHGVFPENAYEIAVFILQIKNG